jgi:CRISPR-associated endonuclease/helicase Cas3
MADHLPRGFTETFVDLTNGSVPYEYQQRMADHLVDTEADVLLTAPTGCGKTWATLAPFLYARATGRPFADRVLYALPLRALANALKAEVQRAVARLGLDVRVTIQTGEHSEDETFEGDIVFTTIDQLLSSYLHLPLSLPRRLGNLNAGVFPGALLVFDEAHLLEPARALGTLLHLMESHAGLTRFVVATATLSAPARGILREAHPGLVEEGVRPEEASKIPVLAHKRRSWTKVESPLDADSIRERHRGGGTLVVVNSVGRAQEIGAELTSRPPGGAAVRVLHSRFYPQHRAAREKAMMQELGPGAGGCNVIIVATQVVEAGLDMSADVLLTELAPANALIQRAGRCARYVSPRHEGEVFVFDMLRNDRGERRLGPYRRDAECVQRTWDGLAGCAHAILGGDGERDLLEHALGEIEGKAHREMLSQRARRERDDEVRVAWRQGDLAMLRERVRDVASVAVILADDPAGIDLNRGPLALSLPDPVWRGFVRALQERGALVDAWALNEAADTDDPSSVRWTWTTIAAGGPPAFAYCLSSRVAAYDEYLGLQLVPSRTRFPALAYRQRTSFPALHYCFETYADHAGRVLGQASRWLARHPVAVRRCGVRYGLQDDLVRGLVLLAAGLHDAAKLDEQWQAAARGWQTCKAPQRLAAGFVAHTDFHPEDRAEERRFRRPPHAVEGAVAVMALVHGWLAEISRGHTDSATDDALRRCVLTAIARHHHARARQAGRFRLAPGALEALVAPLVAAGLPPPNEPMLLGAEDVADFEALGLLSPDRPDEERFWPLACFVVRGLRLADQAGTREGTEAARVSA